MKKPKLWLTVCVASFAAALLIGSVVANVTNAPPRPPKPAEPAFAGVPDAPGLPRVLLLGDSVSVGYTLPLRLQLKGKCNVHRPPANCGSTRTALRDLPAWLGKGKWDIILFNFGLHDMAYVWPDGRNLNSQGQYASRDNGGRQNVPPAEYEKNLRELAARLKKTGARLIWAATTPVPAGLRSHTKGGEAAYNEVAARVMKSEGIPAVDLWSFAAPQLARIQTPGSPHFTPMGYRVLAWHIAQSIQAESNRLPAGKRP